jgi:beta-glucosidase/6-phospho-beta-glucosidase/beta-galactosidase
VTLNEPMVMDMLTYLAAAFPGGNKPLDTKKARAALVNMAYAHAAAYDAIHAAEPDAQVGIAQHYRRYQPENPDSAADRAAAAQWSRFANGALLDAVTSGNLDANADGKFNGPQEGRNIAALKNRLDFVGVNYYSRDKVKALPFPIGDKGFKLKGVPLTEIPYLGDLFKTLPKTDSDWEIYPEGMYESLKEAGQYTDGQGKHLAVIVTENWINETAADDDKRPAFEMEHIAQMQRAMQEGVDVKGYISWSLMDNFEWTNGFGPRFGLLRVDYDDPNRSFRWTDGAEAYKDVIENRGVTPDLEQKWADPAIDPKKK